MREVDITKHHKERNSVVVSSYFSGKVDPQRNEFIDSSSFLYMKNWYESINRLNLKALIFYDIASQEFIQTYSTRNIIFIKCNLGPYSINDERFFLYHEYFSINKYEYILFTDISDVSILRNPFSFLKKNHDKICIGSDRYPRIYNSPWFLRKMLPLIMNKNIGVSLDFYFNKMFNAGVIGGSYDNINQLLKDMIRLFCCIDNNDNNDMQVLNLVLYRKQKEKPANSSISLIWNRLFIKTMLKVFRFYPNLNRYWISKNVNKPFSSSLVVSGYPFTNMFGSFQADKNIYIKHK